MLMEAAVIARTSCSGPSGGHLCQGEANFGHAEHGDVGDDGVDATHPVGRKRQVVDEVGRTVIGGVGHNGHNTLGTGRQIDESGVALRARVTGSEIAGEVAGGIDLSGCQDRQVYVAAAHDCTGVDRADRQVSQGAVHPEEPRVNVGGDQVRNVRRHTSANRYHRARGNFGGRAPGDVKIVQPGGRHGLVLCLGVHGEHDAVHEDARGDDQFGIYAAGLADFVRFGDGDTGGRRYGGVPAALRALIHEVSH